jgi:hypothetical protein
MTRSKIEVGRVLRHAGFEEETIVEILAQLSDPVDLIRDEAILDRYGVTTGNLRNILGDSP